MAVSITEGEPANRIERNLSVAGRLTVGATIYLFLGPFFAYFYLRSLNSAHLWRPAHIHPPQTLGAVIVALTVLSTVALQLAGRIGQGRSWKGFTALSLACGLAAVAVQCVAYTQLGFGPLDGGYADVYLAWTGLTAIVCFATVLWIETLVAWGLRDRAIALPAVMLRLAPLSFYWAFLAGLAVIMWAVLYLVP